MVFSIFLSIKIHCCLRILLYIISDDKVALGTSYEQKNHCFGGVFVLDLSDKKHPKSSEISLDSPVKSLCMLNEVGNCHLFVAVATVEPLNN